jgi:hypothetical protein
MVMIMSNGFTTYVHDFMSRNSARVGYEQRSPMYGRAFIEFALAIPDRQRRRGDVNILACLAAMAQDLPVLVAGRKTKAVFNQPFTRTLDNARSYVLTRMLQCDIDGFEGARLVEFLGPRDRRPGAFWPIYEAWAAFGLLNLFGTVKPGFFERRAE